MRPNVTLRRALSDPGLLGNVLAGETWAAWRVLLIASMGEALTDDERPIFRKLTGREREPLARVEELIAIVGRRGGKSRAISTLAAYVAGLCDHSDVLVPGETAIALLIAPDQRQATIALNYAAAAFEQSPIMRQLVASRTADSLTLTNGISIEVRAASYRRLRGPTFVLVVADEAAFWMSEESANPDTEILNAVRPALATSRGLLAVISSPFAKRGELYEAHKAHYGPAGDPLILVAKAPSRELNPTLPQSVVDRALARDPAAARAEYLAEFRDDIASFIDRQQVEACVDQSIIERAPVPGIKYFSFTDPSGGSSDSMVCAVGHRDRDILIVDAIREIPAPFSPEDAVNELSRFIKSYKLHETVGDRYAAEWVTTAFAKRGIRYKPTEMNRSQLYLELLPRLNAKTIRLLDHPRTINQICLLERRTGRGRDAIDHAANAHDDLANGIAGLCGVVAKRSTYNLDALVPNADFDWARFNRKMHMLSGGGWFR